MTAAASSAIQRQPSRPPALLPASDWGSGAQSCAAQKPTAATEAIPERAETRRRA